MKALRKTVPALLLTASLLAASLPVQALAASATFTDIPTSHWAYESIERAYKDGAVSGTSYNAATGERVFSPDGNVTIPEFMTMMMRAFYPEEYNTSTATGEWYAKALDVANRHCLTDEIFPRSAVHEINTTATRYTMAAIMRNILSDKMPASTKNVWFLSTAQYQALNPYIADSASMDDFCGTAAKTMFYLGVVNGVDSKGTFDGNAYMTRAAAAAVYCRLRDVMAQINAGTFTSKYQTLTSQNTNHTNTTNTNNSNNTSNHTNTNISNSEQNKTEESNSVQTETEKKTYTLTNGQPITDENITALLNTLRTKYPEGMRWTNDNEYVRGNLIGMGCFGFALMCMDEVFGSALDENTIPTQTHTSFTFDDIHPGDFLRVENDTHTVLCLEKHSDSITVVEGNYGSSVHWDRELSREYLESTGSYRIAIRRELLN